MKRRVSNDAPLIYSERKVLLSVLVKIKSLGFDRNPLDGIIPELAAFPGYQHNAPFGAQSHPVLQHGAKAAVGTGFFHSFAKQHFAASFVYSVKIIHQSTMECYPYF